MDRGAWWATVHGVPKSQIKLVDQRKCTCTHTHTHTHRNRAEEDMALVLQDLRAQEFTTLRNSQPRDRP